MTQLKDFDWFIDRLDVAQWKSETSGNRDALTNCPAHGGSDSLHVTEKNGKALVRCFAQQCGYDEIVAALEDAPMVDADEEPEAPATGTMRVTRRGREEAAKQPEGKTAGKADGQRGVRLPAASTIAPEAWLLDRCALTKAELDNAALPLRFTADAVVFDFENGTEKIRGVGEGKAGKKYSWRNGDNAPPLWPMPDQPEEEIVVCEGEMDAIILNATGRYDAYSVTKGANAEVPQVIWDALKARGVEIVRLAFDLDDAGRKGRLKASEGVSKAGMVPLPSRPVGIDVLAGETDVRDVAVRLGDASLVELEDDSDEEDAQLLSSMTVVQREPLLLDRLHPFEHTILFGHGGTGKGVIAAWWVARLTREGKRILVVDYEQHAQYEWLPRVKTFGGDLDMVAYCQPYQPIWDRVGWLRTQIEKHAVDYVVVDSVTYACVGEDVNDSTTAVKYSMAIASLQTPVLSLAHVTKENKDPEDPFGSAFWSNGARVTIAVSRSGPEPDSPRVLRNPKTNQKANFRTVGIRWKWLYTSDAVGEPDPNNPPHHTLVEVSAYSNKRQAINGFYETHGRWPTDPEEVDWDDDEKPVTDVDIRQAEHQWNKAHPKPPTVTRKKSGDNSN